MGDSFSLVVQLNQGDGRVRYRSSSRRAGQWTSSRPSPGCTARLLCFRALPVVLCQAALHASLFPCTPVVLCLRLEPGNRSLREPSPLCLLTFHATPISADPNDSPPLLKPSQAPIPFRWNSLLCDLVGAELRRGATQHLI